jgi:predicted ATPase/DNA-binding XRE family transcriptional regulator
LDDTFGEWVKKRRKGLDITQEELARRVGCSVSAVFKIEAGQRRPSLQIAELLAEHLEIPQDQRAAFLKIARQQKSTAALDSIQPVSGLVQISARQNQDSLPLPASPIVGREHEIGMVIQQLRDSACRLLTLTGPGGVGKTRLALEVGRQLRSFFPDGIFFVSLAGTSSPAFMAAEIADVLGVSSKGADPQKAQLINFLREKRALIILDNLEHLLEGVGLLAEILETAPAMKILSTSREQLSLRAEWAFAVQGLPAPAHLDPARAESNSAVALFLQRARQAKVDFSPDAEDYEAMARICRLVEGLPLGLELAASWVRTLSCLEIAAEIGKGIDFLTAATKDTPERHRSMRAVFDYSWDLLSSEEQHAMMRLSVFRGGFSREAAGKLAGAGLPMLSQLIDKSLVRHSMAQRYEMHELIRQYAFGKLAAGPELEQARKQHFEYFLGLVEQSRARLRGPEQLSWLDNLDADYDNIRAALEGSLYHAQLPAEEQHISETAPDHMRLAGALYVFWKVRNRWAEGRDWLERSLALSNAAPPSREKARALNAAVLLATEQTDTRSARLLADENLALAEQLQDEHSVARALFARATALWKQKDYAAARADGERALAIFRKLGNKPAAGSALQLLGRIALNENALEQARPCLEESLQLFKDVGDKLNYAATISDMGLLAYLCREYSSARYYNQQSLELFREGHNISGIEMALNRLGDIARCLDAYDEAGRLYTECMQIYREAGDKDEMASLLHNLGCVSRQQGAYADALRLFREGLAIQQELENEAGIAECITGIAGVLLLQGRVEAASRLFAAAEMLRHRTGMVLWPANQLEYDRLQKILWESGDKERIAAARDAGRALTLGQAVAEAGGS